jgi:hypothetical protein
MMLAVLARHGAAKEHPAKVSTSLFYLATVIIHGELKQCLTALHFPSNQIHRPVCHRRERWHQDEELVIP